MTWRPSIDEGQDPKPTKPAEQTEEVTTPDEEDTNTDPVEEQATPEAETTITETANTVIFAKSRATNRKNAGRG
jgi:hypothetical protein